MLYDRVEVVRGATGLTTGAGDPSASVNLVRKRANSISRYTILEAGIGRYADFNTMIDHSQALNNSGSVRGRFIAEHKNGNTFIKNEKERYTTLYGNIEADLTDTTKLGLGVSYQKKNVMQHFGVVYPHSIATVVKLTGAEAKMPVRNGLTGIMNP